MGKMKKYIDYEPAVGTEFAVKIGGVKKILSVVAYGKTIKNPCNKCAFNCKTCNLLFSDRYLCGNAGKDRSDESKVHFIEVKEK